jgi:hypothetical protein
MKIVKEFEYEEAQSEYNHQMFYGLGADGKIYVRIPNFGKGEWFAAGVFPSLKMMKRFIKEFDHLLPFI